MKRGISVTMIRSIFYANLFEDSQPDVLFFRKDYDYLKEPRAFYKSHTIQKTWQDARDKCEMEGAKLFYPNDEDEVALILKYWNETMPTETIFVGISAPNVVDVFETVDNLPLADVYHKWGFGEPNGGDERCAVMRREGTLHDYPCDHRYNFICKKSLDSLEWNVHCNIPDTAYEFNEQKGRCYKFHLNPTNWAEAYTICNSEQSYLAIINDQAEADYLADLTKRAPKDDVEGDFLRGAVHLGYKKTDTWKTIKGKKIKGSGYDKWGGGQPDGGDVELCGAMFYNGHLNDISCSRKLFFICEHEIDLLASDFIYKFGEAVHPVKPQA